METAPKADLASIDVDGLKIDVPAHELPAFGPAYEVNTRRLLLDALKPGDTFVDIGAHVGVLSLAVARHLGPTGSVHSVEPSPPTAATLAHNVAANGIENVTIHNCAAGAATSTGKFHLMDFSYLNGFGDHPFGTAVDIVDVDIRRIDDLVSGPVQAIKVDCEGGELDALAGLHRLIAESPGVVLCVEWNPVVMREGGHDPMALLDAVRDIGLEPWTVIDESDFGKEVDVHSVWATVASGRAADSWWGNLFCRSA